MRIYTYIYMNHTLQISAYMGQNGLYLSLIHHSIMYYLA